MTPKIQERDRETTEGRLLEAVGDLIREGGFEKIGVNAVATRSGVSKILIYRYFDSLDGLLAAYVRRYDFWINFPVGVPAREQLPAFLKQVFRAHIDHLRGDAILRRLYRWELSSENEFVARLRRQREQVGLELVDGISRQSGLGKERVAVVASLFNAAATYLALLGEFCPVYNGIAIDGDAGWELITRQTDRLIDLVFETVEQ